MATLIITDNSTGGTHSGTVDTYIINTAATTNYGSSGTMQVQNNGFSYGDQSRALLRFTLPSALNGGTVSAVRLKLYRSDGGGFDWAVDVHEMLRAWVEAEATYNIYSTGNNWATSGGTGTGDLTGTAAASLVILGGGGTYVEWSGSGLVTLLQAKATANASQVDLIVKPQLLTSGPSFYAVFTSSEGTDAQRPILEIDYTPGGDVTAPTLSSPTSAATGKDAGSGTVTTDENNGTLYSVVTLTSTPPSAARVKAGQNASGTLLASGLRPTQAITTTGAKTVAYTGLTTATAYFPYFAHEDSSGNISTVSAGASFTPSTLAYSGTIGAQTGTQGAAFVWSSANPSTLFTGGVGTKSYSGTGLGASGLTVNSSTGVLSGTCGTPGTYNIAIVGTDQSTAGSEIPQTETSNTFTLTISASGDTTRPILGGVVEPTLVTSNSARASWTAASDNSGTIAGYDYQVNGGAFTSLGNVLFVDLAGLSASTAYTVNVRARDPSGNLSTPVITGGFTTSSGAAGTITSPPLKRNVGVSAGVASMTWIGVRNRTTGADVAVKTGVSTNGSGIFSITDAAFVTGTYHVTWIESSGASGWFIATV